MGESKIVRVDNWGVFFLQRLQLFFSKTDYCDLTLQFQGNVQLKVHRLVLNACTEYFELLEHSDRLIDDNVILMPETLQTDVVVPIINFMYTGVLDFPMSLYHKLYQAAEILHMTVLTKLLDAQRQQIPANKTENAEKNKPFKASGSLGKSVSSVMTSLGKKIAAKNNFSELPAPLPGRKLPVWKRKTVLHNTSIAGYSRSEQRVRSDPLALEGAAKPTRFEWPEDDIELPSLDTMDISGFGDISYTSKPLLREDEVKPIVYSQNEVKEELTEMNKEDSHVSDGFNNIVAEKRKSISPENDISPKRIKIVENEKDTTISVISSENSANFDPTKIVSEILKKYPTLVKKNKNIKLKIVTKQKEKNTSKSNDLTKGTAAKDMEVTDNSLKISNLSPKDKSTWFCKFCSENNGKPNEFFLYYLYQKHMADVHNIKFDPRTCKYCGNSFARGDLLSYHLYTKHGIKPTENQVFPSCSHCPYVAISNQALQTHKNRHQKSDMQCSECKLAFISREALSGHIRITGHMGKTRKNTYDCQYCTNRSQSAISLFSHIRTNHEAEGIRDGIVGLDEIDPEEGYHLGEGRVEEGEAEGEYIIPEINSPSNKVKIISDVKVPVTQSVNRTEPETLEHNKVQTSVPTSIATSLGLLDIVVLDESQPFILQNQEDQSVENRTEYILPQIGTRNIRADGLESTTDELVMVLTDQDYKDGHSAITSENSNIVVLYSHPADGQQGQFITSQGNLMVNSDTGLLEIRNGATIATTSSSQIVMADSDSNIETIEMIQREIHGDQMLKEEPIYEDEHKPQISNIEEKDHSNLYSEEVIQQSSDQNLSSEEQAVTQTTHESQIEKEPVLLGDSEPQKLNEAVIESASEIMQQDNSIEEVEIVNNVIEESVENPVVESDKSIEELIEPVRQLNETVEKLDESISDVEIVEDTNTIQNEQPESLSTSMEFQTDVGIPFNEYDNSHVENVEIESNSENYKLQQKTDMVEMEVETIKIEETEEDISKQEISKVEKLSADIFEPNSTAMKEDSEKSCSNEKDLEKPYSPTDNPIDMECELESNLDLNEKQDTESVNDTENGVEIIHCEMGSDNQDSIGVSCDIETDNHDSMEISQCEIETDVQDNDDNSQSSLGPSQAVKDGNIQESSAGSPEEATKIAILDDWEDTDSQQSENKAKLVKKTAQDTVHKLMDDWEEEEPVEK